MTKNVFAGTWEIAAENGMNKSIGRFPDVCMSPPSPPAGPIPIPYPDTSFSNNLKSGSSTVKIGGMGAALAQKSYYKQPILGDEAATRAFGSNVITHQITGKTYFQAWCMDVKFENKNVCRHFDITTSNHGSTPPGTPPAPSAETQTLADAQAANDPTNPKCPCCGAPAHPWQKDENGNPFPLVKEDDFWQGRIDALTDATHKANFQAKLNDLKRKKANARANAAAGRKTCNNVHPNEESGCALYRNSPPGHSYPGHPAGDRTVAQKARQQFDALAKGRVVAAWETATNNPNMTYYKLNHKTPLMGGGCHNPHNVVPDSQMGDPGCQKIEDLQSEMELISGYF